MDIHNRMEDVNKLACNICQDFLKLILISDWQEILYHKAENEINGPQRNKYKPIYEKMRDLGFEKYSVDMMDISAISLVVNQCKEIAPTEKETRISLKSVTENKNNIQSHSGKNEEAEELYLQALLSLCTLQRFVKTIDNSEKSIDNEKRLAFRQKYIKRCEDLKSIIDDERIASIQREKDIQRDIDSIKNSSDPARAWLQVSEIYMQREWKLNKSPEKYYEFAVRASDAGISFAHSHAAGFFLHEKNYPEFERRIGMMIESGKDKAVATVHDILSLLNIEPNAPVSDELWKIIEGICPDEYRIVTNEGTPYWKGKQYEIRKKE